MIVMMGMVAINIIVIVVVIIIVCLEWDDEFSLPCCIIVSAFSASPCMRQ